MENSDRQEELINRLHNMLISFMREFDTTPVEIAGILEFIKAELITNTLYEDEEDVDEGKDFFEDPSDLSS